MHDVALGRRQTAKGSRQPMKDLARRPDSRRNPRDFATPRRLERAAEPALTTLHRLHSGNVGDYVAWLVLGVTAFGALVLVAS